MTADQNRETTLLDEYLRRYREDWIKAGQPSVAVTIAMVNEIERLRAENAELLAAMGASHAGAAARSEKRINALLEDLRRARG